MKETKKGRRAVVVPDHMNVDRGSMRQKTCKRYCCLNCEKFREMVLPMIAEMVESRVREILQESSDYHG